MKLDKLPKAWKNPRPLDEINKLYTNGCTVAGELQYKIKIMNMELDQVNQSLLDLNQEAQASKQMNGEQKKEEVLEGKLEDAPVVAAEAPAGEA